MNGWFIALIILAVLETGIALGKNGEPKTGNYSFLTFLFSNALLIFLIYKAIETGF